MTVRWILILAGCWVFSSVAVAEEAFVLEGYLGTSVVNIYSPQDTEIQPTGNTAVLRFHLPVFQTKSHIVSLTMSSQYLDSKIYDTGSGLTQFVSSTSFGAGINYRFRFFSLGAEYSSGDFRQVTVGTPSTEINYTVALPLFYGGILYRFGRLGLGVIYSFRQLKIPAEKTLLSTERPYDEQSTALVISYHFDGSKKAFFKSLFSGR